MTRTERIKALEALGRERILILDGAMGTQIQTYALEEDDFRGDRFKQSNVPLKGNNDLLSITRPEIIKAIHGTFFDAGADIAGTNTFSSTQIAQADYALESAAGEIARAGAKIAREVADEYEEKTGAPKAVMGAIGPTNRTLSLSPDVEDPGYRAVTFDEVHDSYAEQCEAMADYVDFFLIETVFDTLNAKAAIKSVLDLRAEGRVPEDIPIVLSGTITDASGRTLSGQTTEAFYNSVRHAKPWAVGLNCALGAKAMRQYVQEMSRIAETRIITYPNAGLPNAFGEYDETPCQTAGFIGDWAQSGLVNIVGGCCGTTPAHVKAIAEAALKGEPRVIPDRHSAMRLSGLEPFEVA